MRRLTKFVGVFLCASLICSSALGYSSIVGYAEGTDVTSTNTTGTGVTSTNDTAGVTTGDTTGGTTGSITSNVDIMDADQVDMIATDQNDYFYVDEDGIARVQKKGYYCVILETSEFSDSPYYIRMDSYDSLNNEETKEQIYDEETVKDAIVYTQCAVGDELYLLPRGSDQRKFHVLYSEDGVSASMIMHVTPDEVLYFEDTQGVAPTVSNASITATDAGATFTATISVPTGVVKSIEVRALDADYYTSLDTISCDLSSVKFSYDLYSNGDYEIWCYSDSSEVTVYPFTVDVISSDMKVEDTGEDTVPPELTISVGSEKGLIVGSDAFPITVQTNEVCDISVDTFSDFGVTELTGYVNYNGTYLVTAKDEAGNVTTENVTVTAFGDGSTLSLLDLEGIANLKNENPLNASNRNSYWNTVQFNSGSGSTESALPQTGTPVWYALVIGVPVVLLAGSAFALKKSGVFKRKGGDKK